MSQSKLLNGHDPSSIVIQLNQIAKDKKLFSQFPIVSYVSYADSITTVGIYLFIDGIKYQMRMVKKTGPIRPSVVVVYCLIQV